MLLQRVENKMNLEVKESGEQSSSTVPELTDSVIEGLYKQAQKQRKEFAAQTGVKTKAKRITNPPIDPHVPGKQKWQAIPNAKSAAEPRPMSAKKA